MSDDQPKIELTPHDPLPALGEPLPCDQDKRRIHYETRGTCRGLQNVPEGAEVTMINHTPVEGRCEICKELLTRSDGITRWGDDDLAPITCSRCGSLADGLGILSMLPSLRRIRGDVPVDAIEKLPEIYEAAVALKAAWFDRPGKHEEPGDWSTPMMALFDLLPKTMPMTGR